MEGIGALPTACIRGVRTDGLQNDHALEIKLDHQMGSAHCEASQHGRPGTDELHAVAACWAGR